MTRVLLLGGDLAAFAAALDLAEVGVKVWIADSALRAPAFDVRDPGGHISGLLGELAAPPVAAAPRNPGAAPWAVAHPVTRLRARDGSWQPVPASGVWGIPTFPLSKECIDLVGTAAAFRGYLDRLKPVLTIGKERNFGKLVEARLGRAVRETIVEPLVVERFGVPSHETEVALVEPGLNEALTRAGSLSGGAFQQLEEHTAREVIIEPAVGWDAFGPLLVELLELYGAERFTGEVRSLQPADREGDEESAGWIVLDELGAQHSFDAVLGEHADVSAAVAGAHAAGAAEDGAESRSALSAQLARLAPTRTRQYAEIGIQAAHGEAGTLAKGDALAAMSGLGETGRLFLVDSPAGGTWAARVSAGLEGGARLRLSGPAEAEDGGSGGLSGAGARPPFAEALAKLGAASAAETASVWTRSASHATAAERAERQLAREEWAAEYPSLLVLGESLHGGDLGHAVGEARELAVRLRRKLTGISE